MGALGAGPDGGGVEEVARLVGGGLLAGAATGAGAGAGGVLEDGFAEAGVPGRSLETLILGDGEGCLKDAKVAPDLFVGLGGEVDAVEVDLSPGLGGEALAEPGVLEDLAGGDAGGGVGVED